MKPGKYDFTHEEYLADPAPLPSMTASLAKALADTTLRHAALLHPRINPAHRDNPGRQAKIGSAVHAALLELEGEAAIGVVDAADFRTKKSREERDAVEESGRIALLPHEAAAVHRICVRHGGFFDGCETEQTFLFKREESWFRSKVDAFDDEFIFDLKTTSMPIRQWERRAMWEYSMQIGFYSLALEMACELPFGSLEQVPFGRGFKFVVIEMSEPYPIAVVTPDDTAIAAARRMAWRAMDWWVAYHDQLCAGDIDSLPEYMEYYHRESEMPAWQRDEIERFVERSTYRMKLKEKQQ